MRICASIFWQFYLLLLIVHGACSALLNVRVVQNKQQANGSQNCCIIANICYLIGLCKKYSIISLKKKMGCTSSIWLESDTKNQLSAFVCCFFCSLQRCLGIRFHFPSPITCPAAAIKWLIVYTTEQICLYYLHVLGACDTNIAVAEHT